MRARLFCKHGELRGLTFGIAEEATIGRNAGNEIVLEPKGISAQHARIVYDEKRGRYVLEDLHSLNGTALDGVAVVGSEPLGHLHVITFGGRYDFIFQDSHLCAERQLEHSRRQSEEQAAPRPSKAGAGAAAARGEAPLNAGATLPNAAPEASHTMVDQRPVGLPKQLGQAVGQDDRHRTSLDLGPLALPTALGGRSSEPKPRPATARLRVELDTGAVRFDLRPGENRIGRTDDCEVKIVRGPISRHHAVVSLAESTVRLRDLGSANGTFVNDRRLGSEEVELRPGDRLRFGNVSAALELEGPAGGGEGA